MTLTIPHRLLIAVFISMAVAVEVSTQQVNAQPFVLGDADDDGGVDLYDLDLVQNNFGASGGEGQPGDTNEDGEVNLTDRINVVNNLLSGETSRPPKEPGGELRISAQINQAFDPLTLAPVAMPDLTSFPGFPLVYKVDFFIEFHGEAANARGFGNVVLNAFTNGVHSSALKPGWQPDTSSVDTNGDLPGGLTSTWGQNRDVGAVPDDLQAILVQQIPKTFGSPAVDPRWDLGQTAEAYIGSIYAEWDGNSRADLQVFPYQHSYFDSDGTLFVGDQRAVDVVVPFPVPEPSTLFLTPILLLGFAFDRRRSDKKYKRMQLAM